MDLLIWGFVDWKENVVLNPSPHTQISQSSIATSHFADVGARHMDYEWVNDADRIRMVALYRLHLRAIF